MFSHIRQTTKYCRFFTTIRKSPPLYAHSLQNGSSLISYSSDPNAIGLGSMPDKYLDALKTVSESRTKTYDENLILPYKAPSEFIPSNSFTKILHQVVGDHIHQDDLIAVMIPPNKELDSYFYAVNDLRAIPPSGRTSDPQDILGHLIIEKGAMVPNTYEPNAMYRVCTGDGVTTMSDFITDLIRKECENQKEK